MPIRINLLAESQAAQEQRRKDPVKRAILVGCLAVFSVLLWSSTLQVQIVAARSNLNTLEGNWKSVEGNYQGAVTKSRQSIETEQKLRALENYTTNRFLWGSLLNAFQMTMNNMENLQVTRLKGEQAYVLTAETNARTNGTQVIPGRPATTTEKMSLTIDAVDSSVQTGGNVKRFKEAIASVPYFETHLQKTNGVLLTSLSPPINGPLSRNPYVTFTLQCYFPEKVR
jgi:hypothetical protein